MMKKLCFILVVVLVMFLSCGWALTQEAIDTKTPPGGETGGGLPEVVIKGEARDTVKVDKASYEIEIELEDIVSPSIEETEALMKGGVEILSGEDIRQFRRLNSKQVIKPFLPSVPEPPLVTFHPGGSDLKIKKWELTISDDKGSIVRSLRGKGSAPGTVEWDGRDERGKMIRVGTLYSYNFVATDEYGKPHTTSGKPFQLWALKYDEKESVNIEVANRVLYTSQRDEFSEDGKLIIEKALDILRQYSSYPFKVEICSDEPNLSVWEKAKALLTDYISKNLILLPEDLKINLVKGYERGLTTCFIIQTK